MERGRSSGVVLRSMRSLGTGMMREVAKEALARRAVDIERNFIFDVLVEDVSWRVSCYVQGW